MSPCRFGQKIRDLGFFGEIPVFNSFRQLTALENRELAAESDLFRQLSALENRELTAEKLPLPKVNFLSRLMSIWQARIVDFDLQTISYPMVASDLSLEFGKAAKNAPQDHGISAECFLEFSAIILENLDTLPPWLWLEKMCF